LVTMCGFILALIVLTVRWRHLRRCGEDPGLDVSVLRSPGGLLLVGAMLAVGAVNLFFFSNLFLQYRFGLDAPAAAANLIVAQCAVIAGGLAGGWISGWIGSLRTTALALALGVAAALGFLRLDSTSGAPMTVALLAAFALPTGCLTGSLTKSFLDRADPASSGAASAWRQGAWSLGSTLGGVVTGAVAFGYFTRDWQSALQRAGIADDVAAYAAESVRGGAVLVQLARTPGLEVLKVDSDTRTLLELTASQVSTMQLVGVLAALTYGLALLLILAAMWRIRAHSPNSRLP
jgi:MFS family permease